MRLEDQRASDNVEDRRGMRASGGRIGGGMGLGTRLIAGLTQQLEGKAATVRDNGVRFELRFPVGV